VGVVVTAGVLAVVAAVLDGLVVLLELPHPATASAASGTAKIISSCSLDTSSRLATRGHNQPAASNESRVLFPASWH